MYSTRSLLLLGALLALQVPAVTRAGESSSGVQVELFERKAPAPVAKVPLGTVVPKERAPSLEELFTPQGEPVERYTEPGCGFVHTPTKYSANALALDRSSPFVLRATLERSFPAGRYDLRLRARGAARLLVDGKLVAETKPQKPNGSAHDAVPEPPAATGLPMRAAPAPHQDVVASLQTDASTHRITVVAIIGGSGLYPTPGELSVSWGRPGETPRLLAPSETAPLLTDAGWTAYVTASEQRHRAADVARRRQLSAPIAAEWSRRHQSIKAWLAQRPALSIPTAPAGYPAKNPIDRFLAVRLAAAKTKPTARTGDLEFLRRVTLDTTGVIPTSAEIRTFLADPPATRRERAVDRLLASPGWADHWVSYWQDVLAENPGILKPDLNNTGPFRWWLHQAFEDGYSLDRIVTELVEMEGSVYEGAPAGFGVAALNDAPMADKGNIVAQAFLGQNLACARCHDAPHHPFKQRDLYQLASMLSGKPVAVPGTSTVRFVEGFRKPLVQVTLKPGEPVPAEWPFTALSAAAAFPVPSPGTAPVSRRKLAELIVAPENERFAEVIANRVWKRYLGLGIVEPVDDWTNATPSHPELLRYLGREFVRGGYDLKHLARLILTSDAYQRKPAATEPDETSERRLFAGPARRRLSAEQLVDSLYRGVGKRFESEELNLSPLGDKAPKEFLNLGSPCRAWQFTALSNERDRPALALPISQSIVDTLAVYGWRSSRQSPASVRDDAASPMQALILANGIMGTRVTRLSDDSAFTDLCLQDRPLPELLRETFLRVLSRPPTAKESRVFQAYLAPSFPGRVVPGARKREGTISTDRRVSWANHLSAEATVIRMEEERRLRMGDEPTRRLRRDFRERFEDVLWSLVNSPEFVMVP
jgi:hypothetical protein